MNAMTVNNVELQIKEWNGERVVTFDDIDKVHNRKRELQVEILERTERD